MRGDRHKTTTTPACGAHDWCSTTMACLNPKSWDLTLPWQNVTLLPVLILKLSTWIITVNNSSIQSKDVLEHGVPESAPT